MKYGILGTGIVGTTIAAKLADLGHQVMIGTRNVAAALARTELTMYGTPGFGVWHQEHPGIGVGTFAEAAAFGEVLFNCTSGTASLNVLKEARENNLNGKVLIDIANPLDFSHGMPPTLTISSTDSLAEQIQRAYPQVKVVKSLNTMNANVMVDPSLVPGEHDVFVSGNDSAAKAQVIDILQNCFGWKSVIDLGDITTARGAEMLLPIWVNLMGVLQTPIFNFKVVH